MSLEILAKDPQAPHQALSGLQELGSLKLGLPQLAKELQDLERKAKQSNAKQSSQGFTRPKPCGLPAIFQAPALGPGTSLSKRRTA